MYEHFWDQLLPYLRVTERLYGTPYAWDGKTRKFVLIRDPRYVKAFRIVSLLILTHSALMGCNVLQALRNETSIVLKIIATGFGAVTFAFTVVRWIHQNKASDVVRFLNHTIAFQALNPQQGNHKF
jgi:hypothetical protein